MRVYKVILEVKNGAGYIPNYTDVTVTAKNLEEALRKAGKFEHRDHQTSERLATRPQEVQIIATLS